LLFIAYADNEVAILPAVIVKMSRPKSANSALISDLRLLSLIFLVVLFGQLICFPSAESYATYPLDRFEPEIRAFESEEKASPHVSGQTLFIGSSTFVHWKTLEQDFSDLHAINRGFGGSTIPEINYYEKRLVAKYHPSKIVFYAGTNDIAEGHSGTQVCADFVRFVQAVHKDVPDSDIYFISMSVAPSRLAKQAEFDSGNALIREYIKANPKLHYIDVVPVMLDGDGQLKSEYFGPDHLHMLPAGYAAWMPIIRSALSTP
jgi:lysophospholipase L1-like esterase